MADPVMAKKYKKYTDYNLEKSLKPGEMVLIRLEEFLEGGKDVMYVLTCYTPDSKEPVEPSGEDFFIQ